MYSPTNWIDLLQYAEAEVWTPRMRDLVDNQCAIGKNLLKVMEVRVVLLKYNVVAGVAITTYSR